MRRSVLARLGFRGWSPHCQGCPKTLPGSYVGVRSAAHFLATFCELFRLVVRQSMPTIHTSGSCNVGITPCGEDVAPSPPTKCDEIEPSLRPKNEIWHPRPTPALDDARRRDLPLASPRISHLCYMRAGEAPD